MRPNNPLQLTVESALPLLSIPLSLRSSAAAEWERFSGTGLSGGIRRAMTAIGPRATLIVDWCGGHNDCAYRRFAEFWRMLFGNSPRMQGPAGTNSNYSARPGSLFLVAEPVFQVCVLYLAAIHVATETLKLGGAHG